MRINSKYIALSLLSTDGDAQMHLQLLQTENKMYRASKLTFFPLIYN